MLSAGAGVLVVVVLVLVLVTGVFSGDDGDQGSSGGTVPLAEIQAGAAAESEEQGGFFDEPEGDSGGGLVNSQEGSGSAGQDSGGSNQSTAGGSTFEPSGPPATSDTQTFTTGTHQCPGNIDLVVGPVTSCGFAEEVQKTFSQPPRPGKNRSFRVYSPTTGQFYAMSCSGSNPVKCEGGNDASVYLTDR